MYLEQVMIRNFRGLRSLDVNLERDASVLIGENTWGKSSLLSALTLLLGQGEKLHRFEAEDLYIPLHDAAQETGPKPGEADEDRDDPDPYRYARSVSDSRYQASLADNEDETGISEEEEARLYLEQLKDLHAWARSLDEQDRSFDVQDIYKAQVEQLRIGLVFAETAPGSVDATARLQKLNPVWCSGDDGIKRLLWLVEGSFEGDDFVTRHCFLDPSGRRIAPDNTEELVKYLIRLNPLIRLRDRRMFNDPDCRGESAAPDDNGGMQALLTRLINEDSPQPATVLEGIETLNHLATKYLANYRQPSTWQKRPAGGRSMQDIVNRPVSLESLSSLNAALRDPSPSRVKLMIAGLAGALLLSSGRQHLDPLSHPILVLEDIEARFHPSILLGFWSILEKLPFQKVITTNSSDLLSAVPLTYLRRLTRKHYDTRSYQVKSGHFSQEDLRRIAFHVRINRPIVLFARCWILVEGETEMWMIPEISSILGFNLYTEGVRVLEFAQCGLMPLLKLARQLGIAYFVLTDGDDAGRRYAQTVQSFAGGAAAAREHLLVLPHVDIEHFLYANGYRQTYIEAARLQGDLKKGLTMDRIIEIAIRKNTKPGLAITVLARMQEKGEAGVPRALAGMFSRIRRLNEKEYGAQPGVE